jgi:hypothetical protein
MLSEQITVTTTPTSIRQLIATARGTAVANIPRDCTGIQLRYASSETAIVTLTDTDHGGGSNTGAVVLDAANQSLLSASFEQYEIQNTLLNCNAGTVTVHVVITRTL